MESTYRNRNRGYHDLGVWQDAINFYTLCYRAFRKFPYDLKRVSSQAIGSSDSIHRNIAEGYCRRSLGEYRQFLNYALGSLGESVSGLHAYRKADQLTQDEFDELNQLAYKLENGLLKLVESLEHKQFAVDWNDKQVVKESNALYGSKESISSSQHTNTPIPHQLVS